MEIASKKLRDIMRKKAGSTAFTTPLVATEPHDIGGLAAISDKDALTDLDCNLPLRSGRETGHHPPLLKSASVLSVTTTLCEGVHIHRSSSLHDGMLHARPRMPENSGGRASPLAPHDCKSTALVFVRDVRRFMDACHGLRSALVHSQSDLSDNMQMSSLLIRERLSVLLLALKSMMMTHPSLAADNALEAASQLIVEIRALDNDKEQLMTKDKVQKTLDQVVVTFSRSVMAYICSDSELSFQPGEAEQSYGHLSKGYEEDSLSAAQPSPGVSSQSDIDTRLLNMESGVEQALERAKVWSKYAKGIITYVEKRTALEAEFAKSLSKLAHSSQQCVLENSFVPFQRAFTMAIDQDMEYANISTAAYSILSLQKFVEPLTRCRSEHDRQRKGIKDTWLKSLKKKSDAIANMKKAKTLYEQRWHEFEKAKEISAKGTNIPGSSPVDVLSSSGNLVALKSAEKKKRAEEEAWYKTLEAEVAYKTCVSEANYRHLELARTKEAVLGQVRDLLLAGDQNMKSATAAYFQLRQAITLAAPEQCRILHDMCSAYVPGTQYRAFVSGLPSQNDQTILQRDPFMFEPYRAESLRGSLRKVSANARDSVGSSDSRTSVTVGDDSNSPRVVLHSVASEESDSESHSSGDKSLESSPVTSPRQHRARGGSERRPAAFAETSSTHLDMLVGNKENETMQSKQKGNHVLRKLRTPSRCRSCDSYVYFRGAECEKCGVVCHRKCLHSLSPQCVLQAVPQARRMTTFGVDVNDHVERNKVDVPVIVTRCIQEIDQQGITTKGIYRLSGVKSKVEKLCQSFENDPSDVDLSQHNPVVISNVLKLYLRQLPEPLLTAKLYHDFIATSKEPSLCNFNEEQAVAKLRELTKRLPKTNYKMAHVLLHHLKRVTQMEAENQMNANNLGIVFGPTLLQSNCEADGTAPLSALMDTPHQSRVVEILIRHAEVVFGPEEEHSIKTAYRHRGSLSVEGEENSHVSSHGEKSTVMGSSLPKIDLSAEATEDIKDCNGNLQHLTASSCDMISDLSTSQDNFFEDSDNECRKTLGAYVADTAGGLALSPHRAVARSLSNPLPNKAQATGHQQSTALVCTTCDDVAALDITDGQKELASGAGLMTSLLREAHAAKPVAPPRARNSGGSSLSPTSVPSDISAAPKLFYVPVSTLSAIRGSSLSASTSSMISLPASSMLPSNSDSSLAALTKSSSMTRVVFYSDEDSVQSATNDIQVAVNIDRKAVESHTDAVAARSEHQSETAVKLRSSASIQSMKRMSHTPKFV